MEPIKYKFKNTFIVVIIANFIAINNSYSMQSLDKKNFQPETSIVKTENKEYIINLKGTELYDLEDLSEKTNREIHDINMYVSQKVLGPFAHWYNSIKNETIHFGLRNFFENLTEPLYVLNNLLQGDFTNTGKGIIRFATNSTVGIGGLYDFGKDVIGWERDKEDMGQTFASWGLPEGYGLYMPIIGPITTRKLIGEIVEIAVDPLNPLWKKAIPKTIKRGAIQITFWSIDNFLGFADNIDLIETFDKTSLDSYTTFRIFMIERRIADINDISIPELKLKLNSLNSDFNIDEDELDDFDI